MPSDLARFQRYRLDMECDCGASFFGLIEAGDQWHADHMNKHGTREHPHRLVRNVMLPPLDLRVAEPPSVLSQPLEEIEATWESSHREILRRVRHGD